MPVCRQVSHRDEQVGSGPRRVEFSTADVLLAGEFLDRNFGGRLLLNGSRDADTTFAVARVDAGAFAASDVTLGADLTFAVSGRDQVIVSTMTEGTAQVDRSKVTDRYQPGDVLIGNFPQADHACRTHRIGTHSVTLPVSLLYSVAGAEHVASAPLRFLSLHPASAAARTLWQDTSRYVDDLLANPAAAASSLLIQSAARLLAATTLTVFPNTAATGPVAQDSRDASTVTLRRGVAFIDEHAGKDISVRDIAAAANVSARAIQLAFRRYLDTTPLAHLRGVRLGRAHQELLAADPGRESVTAVAYRWGFSSPSRFAAAYRRSYGVTPVHTLRQKLAARGGLGSVDATPA